MQISSAVLQRYANDQAQTFSGTQNNPGPGSLLSTLIDTPSTNQAGQSATVIANNVVVGNNPLEGSYVTGALSLTPGQTNTNAFSNNVAFELYRNLGLRSEPRAGDSEGAFDISQAGLPTLVVRIKIGRPEDLRALPQGIKDSLLQYFTPTLLGGRPGVTFEDFLSRVQELQDSMNFPGGRPGNTSARRTLSLVIAVNTSDLAEYADNFVHGNITQDRLQSAEVGLAYTQSLRELNPELPDALFWVNVRWRVAPGAGSHGDSAFPGPDNGQPSTLPPGGTPTLRLGIELPKFADSTALNGLVTMTGRLGTGTSFRIEQRPPSFNGGPTIQLADGRVVELPAQLLGVFDGLGRLTGAGTSAEATRRGIAPLKPDLNFGNWVSDLGGDFLQQLTGQRGTALQIPDSFRNQANYLLGTLQTATSVLGLADSVANVTPLSSFLWSRFAQNRTLENFKLGVIASLAPFLTSAGGATSDEQFASYSLAFVGLDDNTLSGWTQTQKDLYVGLASQAWSGRENGTLNDRQYLDEITNAIYQVAVSGGGSAPRVNLSSAIHVDNILRAPINQDYAGWIANRLLSNGADPIALLTGVIRVYNNERQSNNPNQNIVNNGAGLLWFNSDLRLKVARTIIDDLFGKTPVHGHNTEFTTTIQNISAIIPDVRTLGQNLDRLYTSNPGFYGPRITALATHLLALGIDVNLGSVRLGSAIAANKPSGWHASPDSQSVIDSFDAHAANRVIISSVDTSRVASIDNLLPIDPSVTNTSAVFPTEHADLQDSLTSSTNFQINVSELTGLQKAALGLTTESSSSLTGGFASFRDVYKQVFAERLNGALAFGASFDTALQDADTAAGSAAYTAFKVQSGYADAYLSGYGPQGQVAVNQILTGIASGTLAPDALDRFKTLIASGSKLTDAMAAVTGGGSKTSSGTDPAVIEAVFGQAISGILEGTGNPDAIKAAGWLKTIYAGYDAAKTLTKPIDGASPDTLKIVTKLIGNVLANTPGLSLDAKKFGQFLEAAVTFKGTLQDVQNLKSTLAGLQGGLNNAGLGNVGFDADLVTFNSYGSLVQAGIGVLAPFLSPDAQKVAHEISLGIEGAENLRTVFASTPEIVTQYGGAVTAAEAGLVQASSVFALVGLGIQLLGGKNETVQDIGKVASAVSAVLAAVAIGSTATVVGAVVAVFIAFIAVVSGNKPKNIPLGDIVAGSGGAIANVRLATHDTDFIYTVRGNELKKVPLDKVEYTVDRKTGYWSTNERTGKPVFIEVKGNGGFSRDDEQKLDIVTRYVVEANYYFKPLNPYTDNGNGGYGPSLSKSFDVSEAEYNKVKGFAGGGSEGTATAGTKTALAYFVDKIDGSMAVEFRQRAAGPGLASYADYNHDGILDLRLDRSDIKVSGDKYFNGDDGATITLRGANGRALETIVGKTREEATLIANFDGRFGLLNAVSSDSDLLRKFAAKGDVTSIDIANFIVNHPEATKVRTFDMADGYFDMLDYLSNNKNAVTKVLKAQGLSEAEQTKFWTQLERAVKNQDTSSTLPMLANNRALEIAIVDDYVRNGFKKDRIVDTYNVLNLDGTVAGTFLGHNTGQGTLYEGDVTVKALDGTLSRERQEILQTGDRTITRRDVYTGAEFDADGAYIVGTGVRDGSWDSVAVVRVDGSDVDAKGETKGNDRLTGGDKGERFELGAGNDVARGLGGNDVLYGDEGNDRLYGGAGNDKIDGGVGNDRLVGGAGNDDLRDASGRDILKGGAGNDRLTATDGGDRLYGDAGDDTLSTASGDGTRLYGGAGNDTLLNVYGSRVLLNGGRGDDTITNTLGTRDTLMGGAGNDKLTVNGGDSIRVVGGTGDDTLVNNGGTNVTLSGGKGNDSYQSDGNRVTLTDTGGNNFYSVVGNRTTITDGNDASTIAVVGKDVRVAANGGDDLIIAGVAPQTATATTPAIQGARVTDSTILGGAGNDTVEAFALNTTIKTGTGTNTVNLVGNRDTIVAQGTDTVTLSGNRNIVEGDKGSQTVSLGATPAVTNLDQLARDIAAASMASMLGASASDAIAPTLKGVGTLTSATNTTVNTGASADTVLVGVGTQSTAPVTIANNTVNTGAGADTVIVGNQNLAPAPVANPTVPAVVTPVPVTPAPIIVNNTINLGAGNDTGILGGSNVGAGNVLNGQGGNDRLVVTAAGNTANGGAGSDRFVGGDGAQVFNGGTGADLAVISKGRDTFRGGRGNDTIILPEGNLGRWKFRRVDAHTVKIIDTKGEYGTTTAIDFEKIKVRSSGDIVAMKTAAPA